MTLIHHGRAVPSHVRVDSEILNRSCVFADHVGYRGIFDTRKLLGVPAPVFYNAYAAYWYSRLPWRVRRPYAYFAGGEDVRAEPGIRAWRRLHRALPRASAACFPSKSLLELAIRRGHALPRSVHVCPAPPSADFGIGDKETRRPIAVAVGPMGEGHRAYVKGSDRVLEYAREHPDWKFVMLGVGDSQRAFYNRRNIIALPVLPREEVARILAAANTVLVPSRAEGFPVALLEGMMAGCWPVVSEEVRAIPEVAELLAPLRDEWEPTASPTDLHGLVTRQDYVGRRVRVWRAVMMEIGE